MFSISPVTGRFEPQVLPRGSCLRVLLLFCSFALPVDVVLGNPPLPDEMQELSARARLLLSDRCATCHGPDGATREAGLRLDQRADVFRETENGGHDHVVAPGLPAASELVRRITTDFSSERMPPPESGLELRPDEVDLLRRWVAAGAPWQEHWSFAPLDLHAVPPQLDRQVLLERGIDAEVSLRTGVDAFVVRRLIDAGIAPNRPAERTAQLRRLHFDLTGLPPTPAEIDDFLQDTRPTAYADVVDRLLASPRYGERMAASWLDAARYADTYGYQADVYREMWPWRDWVVDAFNTGMSYDRFLTWQIAGDLIPGASRESRLATAFNRNHRQTNEGGSIEEEFHAEYVSDRVNTLGTAMLGLTLECARCHDHKFDPITQREYYQLFAFFNNIDESGLYSHFTDAVPTPTLRLPTATQETELAEAKRAVEAAERRLEETRSTHPARFGSWLQQQDSAVSQWTIADRLAHFTFDKMEDGTVLNQVPDMAAGKLQGSVESIHSESRQAIRFSGDNQFETPIAGDLGRDDPFTIAAWIRADRHHDRAVIWHRSRAWTDAGSRGYELLLEEGKLSAALIHFWPGNALRVRAEEPLPIDRWTHVTVAYDGSSQAAGLSIYVDGEEVETETVRDGLNKTIRGGGADQFAVGARFRDRGFAGGMFDELQIFGRRLSPLEIRMLCNDIRFAERLAAHRDAATSQRESRFAALHASALDPPLREARDTLTAARNRRSRIEDGIREIMAMEEMAEPRETFVLKRGAYDAPGDAVQPDVPASLPALKEDGPRNRLGLARWLTDPRHPLVARVAVNRLWQQLFGSGLTATPEDFGNQGEPPSHPGLLDWLAAQLIHDDWDLKRTVRRIVLSGTYRQSAIVSEEMRRQDPDNDLLSRGPSRRLPMEMIRDAALYAAGLLVEEQGGPPVKPYQPPGLWKEKSRGAVYKRDFGAGSHRRSLYTFWKRTSPPPAMLIFDVPNREVCAARRRPTQTPLQALVLLNDDQYVEAARGCALRVLHEMEGKQPTTAEQEFADPAREDRLLDHLALLLIGRRPSEEERVILRQTLREQREIFSSDESAADEYLAIGDLGSSASIDATEWAAVTVLAQTLMNYAPSIRQP